jgi:hypothetical protein
MKKFKDFISEGDVIYPSFRRPKSKPEFEPTKPDVDTSAIKKHVKEINNEAESIIKNDKKPSWHTPALANQYKGTDVHPLEQLHQHMTAPLETLHDNPEIAKQRKDFAHKVYKDNKEEIHNHLDTLVDKLENLRNHHIGQAGSSSERVTIKKQFDTPTGHVGRFERIKDFFNKMD